MSLSRAAASAAGGLLVRYPPHSWGSCGLWKKIDRDSSSSAADKQPSNTTTAATTTRKPGRVTVLAGAGNQEPGPLSSTPNEQNKPAVGKALPRGDGRRRNPDAYGFPSTRAVKHTTGPKSLDRDPAVVGMGLWLVGQAAAGAVASSVDKVADHLADGSAARHGKQLVDSAQAGIAQAGLLFSALSWDALEKRLKAGETPATPPVNYGLSEELAIYHSPVRDQAEIFSDFARFKSELAGVAGMLEDAGQVVRSHGQSPDELMERARKAKETPSSSPATDFGDIFNDLENFKKDLNDTALTLDLASNVIRAFEGPKPSESVRAISSAAFETPRSMGDSVLYSHQVSMQHGESDSTMHSRSSSDAGWWTAASASPRSVCADPAEGTSGAPKEPGDILADLQSFKEELGSIASELKSADKVLRTLDDTRTAAPLQPVADTQSVRSAEEMAAALEELYSKRTVNGDTSAVRDPADIFGDLHQLKDDLDGLSHQVSHAGIMLGTGEVAPASFSGPDDGTLQDEFSVAAHQMAADLEALYTNRASFDSTPKDPADIFAELEQLKGDLESAALDIKSAGSVLRALEGSSVAHDLNKTGLTMEEVVRSTAKKDLSDVFSDLKHFKEELNNVAEHIEHAGSVLKAFQTEEANARHHIREEWLEEALEGKAEALADLHRLETIQDEDAGSNLVLVGADGGVVERSYGGTGIMENKGWGYRGTTQHYYAPPGAVPGSWNLRSTRHVRPRAWARLEAEIVPVPEDGNGGIGRVPFVAVSGDDTDPLRELGTAFDAGDRWKERPTENDATSYMPTDLEAGTRAAAAGPIPPVLRRRRPWESAASWAIQAGAARPLPRHAHRSLVPWASLLGAPPLPQPSLSASATASSDTVATPAAAVDNMRTDTSRAHQKWVELGVGTLAAASVVATALSSKVSKRMAARTAQRPHLLRNSLRAFWQSAAPSLEPLATHSAPPMWIACAGAVAMAHICATGAHSPTTMTLGASAVVAAAAAMIAPPPSARGRALSKIGLPFTVRIEEDTSMWALAQKYYGSGSLWRCLGDANPHVSPKTVQSGSLLRVYLPASQPQCPPCSFPPRPRM